MLKSSVLRDSAILSFKEFQSIKRYSQFNPEPEPSQIEDRKNTDTFLAKARAHRDKIKAYDKLHLQTVNLESEEESVRRKKNEEILTRAQRIIENQDDAVKTMDKMVLYAQIATIRDRQREDTKKNIEIDKKKEEKLDILMEINRIKDMKQQEEIENERRKQQREGSLVIIDQIKARKEERKKEKYQAEKEMHQLLPWEYQIRKLNPSKKSVNFPAQPQNPLVSAEI